MGHRVTGLSAERGARWGSLVAGHGLLMAVLAHVTGLLQFVQTKRYALKMSNVRQVDGLKVNKVHVCTNWYIISSLPLLIEEPKSYILSVRGHAHLPPKYTGLSLYPVE